MLSFLRQTNRATSGLRHGIAAGRLSAMRTTSARRTALETASWTTGSRMITSTFFFAPNNTLAYIVTSFSINYLDFAAIFPTIITIGKSKTLYERPRNGCVRR